jgi:hypothetical protein
MKHQLFFFARASFFLLCCLLYLAPLVYATISILELIFIGSRGYKEVLQEYWGLQRNGFDIHTLASTCFTPQVYQLSRSLRWVLIPLLATGSAIYILKGAHMLRFFKQFLMEVAAALASMGALFRGLSLKQGWGLLILFTLIAAYRICLFFAIPLHPDEVFSYLFFARQGGLITATNPNNHALLNLICAAFDRPGWLSPMAVMRLPSMAADMVLLAGIFYLFMRWGGYKKAVMVVGGVAFCYYSSYYAVQGRGYELQVFCALVSGVAAWDCFCGPSRQSKKNSALFAVFSVAGFYATPTFLYHFTAIVLMCGYFLFKRKERFRDLLSMVVGIGLTTLVMYLPLILAGGWSGLALMAPDKVEGFHAVIHKYRLVPFVLKDITYYGMAGFVLAGLFGAWAIYLYIRKWLSGSFYDGVVVYGIALNISLMIWTLYSRSYPYERTLCFAIFGLYVLFGSVCYDVWKLYVGRMTPWFVVCFVGIKAVGSARWIYWSRYSYERRYEVRSYRIVEEDFDSLDRLHPVSWQVEESKDWYPMYLRMHLLDHGWPENVIVNADSAVADVVFIPDERLRGGPKKGYTLWKVTQLPEAGKTDIYVADKLLLQLNF